MLKLAKEMDELASDIVVLRHGTQRHLSAASFGERLLKELAEAAQKRNNSTR